MAKKKHHETNEEPKDIGRPPKYKTPEELEKKIDEYFADKIPKPITYELDGKKIALTDKQGNIVYTKERPTLAGLSVFLGYADRQSLYDQKQRGDDFSCVIKRAVSMVEVFHEENLFEAYCTGSIFWLKVHGWDDKNKDDREKDDLIKGLMQIASKLTGVQ
mgnify:CR=1 FL=1